MFNFSPPEQPIKKSGRPKRLLSLILIFIIIFISFLFLKNLVRSRENSAALNQTNITMIGENLNEALAFNEEPLAWADTGSIPRLIKEVNLDISFLEDWNFSSLVEYGRRPAIRERGRANPFDPY